MWVPPKWSWKYPALVTEWFDGEDDECRSWEERFEIDMQVQEPRRNLGMEQVGEEEKADFFVLLKC